MKTLRLDEAANMLGMHKETLRLKAQAGDIRGIKPLTMGQRSWVFLESDIEIVLLMARELTYSVTNSVTKRRTQPCYTNAGSTITTAFTLQDDELEALLNK